MHTLAKNATFIFISMLICSSAFAGRPFSTEDATVADKGAVEAEISADYVKGGNEDENYNFTFVAIYGLTDIMEFSAELPINIIKPNEGSDEEGLGDISLILKTLILPEKEIMPSFLLKTTVKLSNGDEDRGLGSGDEDIGFVLAATKCIGPATFHVNIGYTFVGTKADDTLNDYLLYGAALEYSINQKLSVAGEIYGESDSHFDTGAFEHHTINPLIGLIYQLTEKMTLDAAFKVGIHSEEKANYGIMGGVSIAF